jgi:membrane protease YdiL (CAAX protease family)
MTHDIVQSDIDLAQKLLKALHPDEEILSALTRRGVDPVSAVRLISYLHDNPAKTHSFPGLLKSKEFEPALEPTPEPGPFSVQQPAHALAGPAEEACLEEEEEEPPQAMDAIPTTDVGSPPRAVPRYLWVLEVLLIVFMLLHSGVFYIVYRWIHGSRILVAPSGFYSWLYWFLMQATAVCFLLYVLYLRSGIHSREVRGSAAVTPDPIHLRVLEFGLVLSVAFQGSIVSSFFIFAQDLPLPEPALTALGLWSAEAWQMLDQAGELGVLAYVLYRGSRNFASIGLNWTSHDVALALPVAVATFFISWFCLPLAHGAFEAIASHDLPSSDVSWALVGPTVTIATVLGILLNGFAEELIVRAYLMTEILRLTRSSLLAVFCSVAVQVSYHFYQGAPAALSHIGWCLLFSVFYLKTRRILPLVLAHNFMNFTILLRYVAQTTVGL